jgi:HD-like signal output (HDOD) protein
MSITESELITHLKKLPPLPAPLQQVLSFLNDPQSNWAKIGKVMLKDPVLTGRVLQIANSSFYGLHRQVKDIEIACSVLGAETLRSLVYTLILLSKFRHGQKGSLIDYDLLWRNSLAVACLVKKIARQSRQDPTTAFTIGLFHSLDLIIQDYFFSNVLVARFEKYRIENSLPSDVKIHSMIDTEYWWLSSVLLEHWQFPEPIVSAFRNTPDTPIPKMKVIVLASNMILRNLDSTEKILDHILFEVTTLFEESELSGVDFQECVYDSQKLYQEMSSWMFS